MERDDALYSTMIRAGKTTFFIDVKEAKNGNRYLQISGSRLDRDGNKKRATLTVFDEYAPQFRQAIDEATAAATQ